MDWKTRGRIVPFAFLACALIPAVAHPPPLWAQSPPGPTPGPLGGYTVDRDPAFAWEVRQESRVAGVPYVELTVTSQRWMDVDWRHQVLVFRPSGAKETTDHAIVYVDGGRWDEHLDDPRYRPDAPSEATLYALAAELAGAPVVVVRQVPFQPLFDGLTEDALISVTFQRFLETGDPEWPLLLPMVKSVSAAMDAASELAREEWGHPLERFTVTGGSKRGWTTWLLPVVDDRVRAIVPIVIDLLNLEEHLDHQIRAWGEFSPMIADYTEAGLHETVDSPEGQQLLDMVDPYRYRDRITVPKLIVLASNDAYWPVDALNLYWDELEGPGRILYIPNVGHSADDYSRVLGALVALHRHVMEGAELPEPAWRFDEREDRLLLRVEADARPLEVTGWSATVPDRDFRGSEWTSRPCHRDGDGFLCEVERPAHGHTALFAEVSFPGQGVLPLRLSTQVRLTAAPGTGDLGADAGPPPQ